MRPSILVLGAAASVLALEPLIEAILPSTSPTGTYDYWTCAHSTYSVYFDPPKPTGTLLSAFMSYNNELLSDCTERPCRYPESAEWCAFTRAAPSSVLPAWSSYASNASMWWQSHSSAEVKLAVNCPHYWWMASMERLGANSWLNQTII
ncbi:hypothetical protein M011DRAFT_452269, partial [Sporormia fimetaria CBS 119925]